MKIAVPGGTGTVGIHVVDVLRERGHEPVVLTRSTGVDLVTGDGLPGALEGVDVVIDVVSKLTQNAKVATEFFDATTRNLLAAEKAAGVKHHVLLGIVGSQKSQYGYYLGKMVQERLMRAGDVPWTEVRATQFHEFSQQIYGVARIGPIVLAPNGRVQPIAAREVAERLVELAEGAPARPGRRARRPARREPVAHGASRRSGHRQALAGARHPGARRRRQGDARRHAAARSDAATPRATGKADLRRVARAPCRE